MKTYHLKLPLVSEQFARNIASAMGTKYCAIREGHIVVYQRASSVDNAKRKCIEKWCQATPYLGHFPLGSSEIIGLNL